MKTKTMSIKEGKQHNIDRFPSFHKTGSIRGMKKNVLWPGCSAGAVW